MIYSKLTLFIPTYNAPLPPLSRSSWSLGCRVVSSNPKLIQGIHHVQQSILWCSVSHKWSRSGQRVSNLSCDWPPSLKVYDWSGMQRGWSSHRRRVLVAGQLHPARWWSVWGPLGNAHGSPRGSPWGEPVAASPSWDLLPPASSPPCRMSRSPVGTPFLSPGL